MHRQERRSPRHNRSPSSDSPRHSPSKERDHRRSPSPTHRLPSPDYCSRKPAGRYELPKSKGSVMNLNPGKPIDEKSVYMNIAKKPVDEKSGYMIVVKKSRLSMATTARTHDYSNMDSSMKKSKPIVEKPIYNPPPMPPMASSCEVVKAESRQSTIVSAIPERRSREDQSKPRHGVYKKKKKSNRRSPPNGKTKFYKRHWRLLVVVVLVVALIAIGIVIGVVVVHFKKDDSPRPQAAITNSPLTP